MEMSDYERQRLARMEANKRKLEQLEIGKVMVGDAPWARCEPWGALRAGSDLPARWSSRAGRGGLGAGQDQAAQQQEGAPGTAGGHAPLEQVPAWPARALLPARRRARCTHARQCWWPGFWAQGGWELSPPTACPQDGWPAGALLKGAGTTI
jgi:hypothetical protein